jgi:hypothetical protein
MMSAFNFAERLVKDVTPSFQSKQGIQGSALELKNVEAEATLDALQSYPIPLLGPDAFCP